MKPATFARLLGCALVAHFACSARLEAAFTDVTQATGIAYTQSGPAAPDIAVYAGAAAAVDVDGDGWTDFVAARSDDTCLLFMNNGDGTFREEAAARGLGGVSGIGGIAAGDFSNNGHRDLFMVPLNGSRCYFFANDGTGHFTEVAVARGVDLPVSLSPHQGFGVSLVDYDRDGWLDIQFSEWGVPASAEDASHSALLHNRGAADPGHFENRTVAAGMKQPRGGDTQYGYSAGWADFDGDEWPDCALIVDFKLSQFYWNNGNGTFSEGASTAGVAHEENGMGVAIADIDRDGRLDLFVGSIFDRLAYEQNGVLTGNKLYRNLGDRHFSEISTQAGVDRTGWAWGAAFFEFDNNGDPDLVVTNGITEGWVGDPNAPFSTDSITDPTTLFINDGTGRFTDSTSGSGISDTGQGRAIVVMDYDNDGDEDLVITQAYGSPIVYRSDASTNGNDWIRFQLRGTTSNRDGIGAVVRVTSGGRTRVEEYNPTNAYIGQREPFLHFGLGAGVTAVDSVEVRWPSGIVQTVTGLATDQVHLLVEPGAVQTPPVITTDPVGAAVFKDAAFTLTAAATGDPVPVFVWSKNGVPIPGATGPTYRFARMHPIDAGSYTATAINPLGSVMSAPAVITVKADIPSKSVARWWNEALLDAIRADFPAPTIHSRNLYHVSAAMWDAYWPYSAEGWSQAVPAFHKEIVENALTAGARDAAWTQAISHAAYTVLMERYKNSVGRERSFTEFRWLMEQLGCDPDSTDTTGDSPAAVGNRIGAAELAANYGDGSNEANGYADTSGYAAVNDPLRITTPGTTLNDPNRWQPLQFDNAVTQNGIPLGAVVQSFVGVNWRAVRGFAISQPVPGMIADDPGPPPYFGTATEDAYRQSAVDLIRFSSMLDPDDGVFVDISPSAHLNNPLGTNAGTGHPVNPETGQPYEPDLVLRADYGRVLAEYWADGPSSETPPGHWNVLFNEVADDPRLVRRVGGTGPVLTPLEWDVRGYLALNGALHDAAIAAWTLKRQYDSIRPISIIRFLGGLGQSSDPAGPSYNAHGLPLIDGLIEVVTAESSAPGQRHAHLADKIGKIAVRSWSGQPADPATQEGGVGWILAENWIPYQKSTFVTPSFPGYISGHSTFSRAGAEVLTLFTGSPFFPGGIGERVFKAGEFLKFEDGPLTDVHLQWATYYDAADQAGISRLWGGIHVSADDFAGRRLGSQIGFDAYAKANRMRRAAGMPAELVNLSARGRTGPGEDVLITGFAFAGNTDRDILVRSVGPGLEEYGVADFDLDPSLELHRAGTEEPLLSNDDWGMSPNALILPARMSDAGAFALTPGGTDAAEMASLAPGGYTVLSHSAFPEDRAVVLAEVYGRDLVNISSRGNVGTGDKKLIAGFVLAGDEAGMVLIRGVGPALADYGVGNVLADPVVEVFRQEPSGPPTLIASNGDWWMGSGESVVEDSSKRGGAFPLTLGGKDAALVLQLAPGAYTAVVSSGDGSEGIALVEVYHLK